MSAGKIDWGWIKETLVKKEKLDTSKDTLLKILEECLKEAKSIVTPKAVSIKKTIIAIKRPFVELENSVKLSGDSLSSYIKGASDLEIFLVTLGGRLENTATDRMNNNRELEGYLLDRIGSFAVESLAENFEDNLRDTYKTKGLSVSMRFSPGYCDWPIEEQFVLAKILDFSKAGVHLTGSCMMIPKKSISAVVGIGAGELFSKKISQCSICDIKECDYRRTKQQRARRVFPS